MTLLDPHRRLLEDLGLRPEDEDAESTSFGKREQLLHEVDPRDALGQRIAEELRRPYDRLTVSGHELATTDDFAELRVVLHSDELGGVDRDMLGKLTLRDQLLAASKRARHIQAVDAAVEDFGAIWRDRGSEGDVAHTTNERR